jgi:hypothetical protein
MPRIIKEGDPSQGHCWPPTTPKPYAGLLFQVYVNNKMIAAVGDAYFPHPGPCGLAPPHIPGVSVGSPNVFVNKLGILRDGDPLSCGDTARSFLGEVYANGA